MPDIKNLSLTVALTLLTFDVRAGLVYTQPHNGGGSLYQSAVNGTDYDQLTWDLFRVTNSTAITEIRWRGGYLYGGTYSGAATNWTIAIYRDVANGYQPAVTSPPFVSFTINGRAGETPAGTFGSTALFDYSLTLPAAFQAVAGSNYWLLIQANQVGIPEWGFALGSGGDGGCFRRTAGMADWWYYRASGDLAFSLLVADGPTVAVAASGSPAAGGEILGAGNYPVGSTAAVTANPAAGYGFVNWTQNGSSVGSAPTYQFTASSNRTLVANFVPAYPVAVSPSPAYGGSATGGGTFNSNALVTVTATPNNGYKLVNWTEYGNPVSASAGYSFSLSGPRTLVAYFAPSSVAATFDFDTATPALSPGQGMPGSQSHDGVTAYFSRLTGGWSVQSSFYYGWKPSVFSGNFLYPSQSGSTLAAEFSEPVTNFSVAFFTGEVSSEWDTAGLVRVIAYSDSALTAPVATNTVRGAWVDGAYPSGTLTLSSPTPFIKVKLDMPSQQSPTPSYLLFVDNFVAQLAAPHIYTVSADVAPANAGTLTGDGVYPERSDVTLLATPAAGYAFLNWTQNGVPVSSLPTYGFTVLSNSAFVANFVPVPLTWTITTSTLPSNGGFTWGDGLYTNGEPVTVSAYPGSGYDFAGWTENNAPVSAALDYGFPAATNRFLIANFVPPIIPQLACRLAGTSLVLSWPTNSVGFTPEETPDLRQPSWAPSPVAVNLTGPNYEVILPLTATNTFYRLAHP